MDLKSVTQTKYYLISAHRHLYFLTLLAIVTLTWCTVYHRWTPAAWATPVGYSGDALGGLIAAKAMARGEILPLLAKFPGSLGAPFVANLNDYPSTEEAIMAGMALMARIFGLFSGSNLTLLSAHLLAAASFYFVCRYLRYHPLFALAGAAVFALSRFAFVRSLGHITLTFYWHIPLGLLVIAWCIAATPFAQKRVKAIFCIVVAVIFGSQSPYYTWLFAQFLFLAAAICFLRGQRKRALWPICIAAVVFATFVLMNADTFYSRLILGPNPGAIASRSFPDLERYAMKPIELLIPHGHRIEAIESWSVRSYFDRALFLGETRAPYLGVVGIAALIILLGRTATAIATRSAYKIPSHFWGILWVLSYSVVGGIGSLFGVVGLILFRCSNRYSIVILALLLLFLVKELTNLCRGWSFPGKLAFAAGVLAVGIWDQPPRFLSAQDVAGPRWQVIADRTLVSTLESKLPRRAMIFQLPVVDFPESPPIERMGDYEQFRPYLHSRALRFSHGSHKGRYRERWQREVEQFNPDGLVETLERYGFAAVLINKAGYKDSAASLVASLAAAGRGTILAESPDFVSIALSPHARPLLPPEFDRSWSALEGTARENTRWSEGDATIKLSHTEPGPAHFQITFTVSTPAPRNLEIWLGSQKLYSAVLKPETNAHPVDLQVTVPPEGGELSFRTDAPAAIVNEGDPRKLAYAIHNFRVELL